ncbi:MAG: type II toxin-antitoxin system Phd/YefM family antitoxin [Armatimonadetes bacterium]|nr:type II toxin-antitoxin system Phd/YefM family antitoxin [Armatimonadota bacterium]
MEDTRPITDPRHNTPDLVEQSRRSGRPAAVTHRGRSISAVEDVRTYKQRLSRLELAEKVARGIRAAEQGDFVYHSTAMKRLETVVGE